MTKEDKIKAIIDIFVSFAPKFKRHVGNPNVYNNSSIKILSMNQQICFDIIHEQGKCSMTFLSSEMGISKQQVTRVVDDLIKYGYVTRCRCENNRRLILAAETEEGIKYYNSLYEAWGQKFKDKFDNMNETELDEMLLHLNAISNIFKQRNARNA